MRRGCFGADREKNVEKKRDSENLRCWVKRKKSKRDKRGMVDNVECSSEKNLKNICLIFCNYWQSENIT